MKASRMTKKVIIGRREWARFPELKIGKIEVRVDTGARTSSIHGTDAEEFEKDGEQWVRFNFNEYKGLEAPLWKQKYVRSSNGKSQHRYFIRTTIRFANGQEHPISISLTCRGKMTYPVLLGRRLLSGKFLVDSGKSFLLGDDVSK